MLSSIYLGSASLPKEWQEKKKEKEKATTRKSKDKNPTYKLKSNIEISIDIKSILEEKILNAKIKFIPKMANDIAKKNFNKLIINVIKKKR